ncbi:hypothetical protein BN1002_01230 [Bacillus sp. B-jedd]|nr:hypothetical protein BN1002_01230 [Bacillus sp. B-jedd]
MSSINWVKVLTGMAMLAAAIMTLPFRKKGKAGAQ